MATEIGVAYVSIVPSTDKIAPAVSQALNGPVAQAAAAAGPGIGTRLASGIGTTLKAGAVTAGAAAGLALGTALSKGLARLTAIDNAQAKLSGLGNSAEQVGSIMKDVAAAVDGTAFSVGDAADVAARALAAGIKPGEDLQRTLKDVGDAAAFSGKEFSEIGQIWAEAASSGTVMGDTLQQLEENGVPALAALSKEMGKTQGEVKKLASDGKISFEQFQTAMEHFLGGTAEKMGGTFSGSLRNMQTALGKLGAAILDPAFKAAPGIFQGITASLKEMTADVSHEMPSIIARIQKFGTELGQAFEKFKGSDAVQNSFARVEAVVRQLADAALRAAPAIGQIGKSLATASAAVGVSAWQIFLSTLEAATGVINALVPVLQTVASLMSQHQGLVNAAALAWVAFKTVPNALNLVQAAVSRMNSAVSSAVAPVKTLTSQTGAIVDIGNRGSVSMGKFGSAIAKVGESVPAVARMQQSFVSAASGAERFGRTAGVASAAMTGLKSAGSAVAGVFGGPIGLALTAVATGLAAVASNAENTRAIEDSLKATTADLAANMQKLGDVMSKTGGAWDTNAIKQAADSVKQYRDDVSQTATQVPGFFDKLGASVNIWADAMVGRFGAAGDVMDEFDQKMANAKGAEQLKKEIDSLGLSNEQLAEKLSGSDSAFTSWIQQLSSAGKISQDTVETFVSLRNSMQEVAAAAQQTGKLTTGLRDIATAGGDATQTLNGLKTALQGLGLIQSTAAEAAANLGDSVRQIAADAKSATGGMQQFATDGKVALSDIDAMSQGGSNLIHALQGVGDAFLQARSNGVSASDALKGIQPALDAIGSSAHLNEKQVRDLATSFGVLPADVNILLAMQGADAIHRDLAGVTLALTSVPKNTPVKIHLDGGDESVAKLRALGIDVTSFDKQSGTATVSVNDQGILDKLGTLKGKLGELGANPTNVTVGATDNATSVANAIDQTFTTLANKPVKTKLDADPQPAQHSILDVSKAADDLNKKPIKPVINAQDNATPIITNVSKGLDGLHDKTITVTTNYVTTGTPPQGGSYLGGRTPGRWAGGTVPKVPGFASGFRLPKRGPGTEIRDGFLGIGAKGMPTVRVDAGEWVINNQSSDKWDWLLRLINQDDPGLEALLSSTRGTVSASVSAGPSGISARASFTDSSTYVFNTVDVDGALRSADRTQQRKCARYGSR
ncbi:MAG: tape measure protein [Nocardiaceae bacterium]|nr:tape measure protein [Nocardiaceae bacterium]